MKQHLQHKIISNMPNSITTLLFFRINKVK